MTEQQAPYIRCPHCHAGSIPLDPHLRQVWDALDASRLQTAAEVGTRYGGSREATDHRLKQLAALGLARIAGRRPQPAGVRGGRRAAEWVRVEQAEAS